MPQAAQAVESPEANRPKVVFQIREGAVRQKEFAMNSYVVTVPADVTEEQLLDERCFAHFAYKLKKYDEITVFAEDLSWRIDLQVLAAGRLYAQTAVNALYEYGTLEELSEKSEYAVDYGGGNSHWRVRRGNDIIKEGFESKTDALRWVKSHEEALYR